MNAKSWDNGKGLGMRDDREQEIVHVEVTFPGAIVPRWRPDKCRRVTARVVRGRISRGTSCLGIDLWGPVRELKRALHRIRTSFKTVHVHGGLQTS